MLDKHTLLAELQHGLQTGTITRTDIEQTLTHTNAVVMPQTEQRTSNRFSRVFSILGAVIVLVGIIVLLSQNWALLASPVRIFVTLGIAVITFWTGLVTSRSDSNSTIATSAHIMAALLWPVGLLVTLYEAHVPTGSGAISLLAVTLAVMYAVLLLLWPRKIFTLVTTIASSVAFLAGTEWLLSNSAYNSDYPLWLYRFLVLGVSYYLIGRLLDTTRTQTKLAPWFYTFGAGMAILTSLLLGSAGTGIDHLWEIICPIIAVASLYGGVMIRRTSLLITGSIGFVVYLFYMSARYFSNSLSWPLIIIFCGLMMIAMAWLTVYLNRRFIK
jgi:preprotein translocase subunit Sss1